MSNPGLISKGNCTESIVNPIKNAGIAKRFTKLFGLSIFCFDITLIITAIIINKMVKAKYVLLGDTII